MSKFNAAVLQLKVTGNKDKNIEKAGKRIADIFEKRKSPFTPDIVVLPEMFNCPYEKELFPSFAEVYPGESANFISSLSKKFSVYIIAGSIPEKENGNIYNTSYAFDRNGKLIARHRKIHLFDVDIKDRIRFCESEALTPGSSPTVFETEFCKMGIAICYDVRFPELIRKMALEGAKVIAVPAAFNMVTGPAHWHITIRTRALDNQVFLIAASPARNKDLSYIAYGHSLVADPWGKIISEAGTGERWIFSEIDLEYLEKVRRELPLLCHRREELY